MAKNKSNRVVHIVGPIESENAAEARAALLALDAEDQQTPIILYIDSPGGSVIAGMSIYDTMKSLRAPVHTVCGNLCAGIAATIYSKGAQGHREAGPNAVFMFPDIGTISFPSTTQDESKKSMRSLEKMQNTIAEIFGETTGHSKQEAQELFSKNKRYTAEEAKEAGIVDKIEGSLPCKLKP